MGKTATLKPARTTMQSQSINHGKLGKRIEIGSTAHVYVNAPESSVTFHVPSIQLIFGIGKDHVGYLIMDEDAWKALKKGHKINIDSIKKFTKKFL